MGLLSKLKPAPGAQDARSGATPDANEFVRDARARARRRLIGAALLLGVGIIGFPLLFETQPRPVAVDIPIEIPSRDAVAPLQSTGPRPVRTPAVTTGRSSLHAGGEVVRGADTQSAPANVNAAATPAQPSAQLTEKAAARAPEPRTADTSADKSPAKSANAKVADVRPVEGKAARPADVKPAAPPAGTKVVDARTTAKTADPRPADAKPADVRVSTKPVDARAAPKPADSRTPPKAAEAERAATDDEGRFVVQIGAFAEVSSARDARTKVESMGLKTYTQVIESSTGRRIRVRVGPYANKAEADKAAARLKSGGLQAAVLKL